MKYVLAVKRSARATAPKDWLERLRSIRGVEVLGTEGERATIRADARAKSEVVEVLGAFVHIERVQKFRSI